jgi:4a-hydroxytetrahydrobiopterin dehydratase
MAEFINARALREADLPDWRLLVQALHARFDFPTYAEGLTLLASIGVVANELDHHPDLDLRYGHLNVKLASHDVGGVTDRDVQLARRISELARQAGATPRPELTQALEFGLDTADWARIRPFWKAVLGGSDNARLPDEVRDLDGSLPTLWFQETDGSGESGSSGDSGAANAPAQRWHPDIHVPADVAEARIAAALDAGGTLVTAEHAPSFTVLADPNGNKVCVCTSEGRD